MQASGRSNVSGTVLKFVAVVFAAMSLFLVTGVGQAQETQGVTDFVVNDDASGTGPNGVNCANEDFDTIQEAVDAASNGSTISVCSGTYTENVNVNKEVTIDGAQSGVDARDRSGNESVVQATANVVITIAADNVEINGFTVQGSGNGNDIVGISAPGNVSGYNIFNNIVQNNTFGIYANGNFGQIEQNLIQDNNRPGAAAGNGIYADQGSNNIGIENNRFEDHENTSILFTTNGGSAPNNTNIQILNNDIIGNRILLIYTDDSLVQGNSITNSLFSGVQMAGGTDGITVRDNNISGSGATTEDQFPFAAVRVGNFVGLANANIEAVGNNLVNNDAGVSVASTDSISDALVVRQNRIFGNDIGIFNGDPPEPGNDRSDGATIDAENNWWGCNVGPNNGQCDTTEGANIDFRPWIVMTISAPESIRTGGSANVFVRFFLDRGAGTVARQFPDGVRVAFDAERGSVSPRIDRTDNGVASTRFSSSARNRTAVVTATTDAQTVRETIQVLAPR